jgi:hypothetical protein
MCRRPQRPRLGLPSSRRPGEITGGGSLRLEVAGHSAAMTLFEPAQPAPGFTLPVRREPVSLCGMLGQSWSSTSQGRRRQPDDLIVIVVPSVNRVVSTTPRRSDRGFRSAGYRVCRDLRRCPDILVLDPSRPCTCVQTQAADQSSRASAGVLGFERSMMPPSAACSSGTSARHLTPALVETRIRYPDTRPR